MEFEWDPEKARQNLAKHKISFHEAATVFGDPWGLTFDDPEHSVHEQRFITIGESAQRRIIIVSHTDRDDRTRIISARQATHQERAFYERQR